MSAENDWEKIACDLIGVLDTIHQTAEFRDPNEWDTVLKQSETDAIKERIRAADLESIRRIWKHDPPEDREG